jgi:hypothetical protein
VFACQAPFVSPPQHRVAEERRGRREKEDRKEEREEKWMWMWSSF